MVNNVTALCIILIIALYALPMSFVCPLIGVEIKGGLLGDLATWLDCTPHKQQLAGIFVVIGAIFYFFGDNIRFPSIKNRIYYRKPYFSNNFPRRDRTPPVKNALIVLVILLLSLFYMTNPNFKESINNAAKSITNSSIISNSCEENAKTLIPNSIFLYRNPDDASSYDWSVAIGTVINGINDYSTTWTDDSSIGAEFMNLIYFRPGNKEEENVNYMYFASKAFTISDSFTYNKRIVAANGNIKGYRTFAIRPTLKEVTYSSHTIPGVIGGYWELKEFQIVEPNFVSCDWVA